MEGVERPLKLHFISYPAPGHMIPVCDLATMFASRGQQVTIITTPSNVHFFTNKSTSSSAADADTFFRVHTIDFPSQQVGLPDGVEYLSSTTDEDTSIKIGTAAMLLNGPIADFMEKDPPDFIIADCIYPGFVDTAHKLQIPVIAFTGFSIFAISLIESLRTNDLVDSDPDSDFVPNFPHRITMCPKPSKSFTDFMGMMLNTIRKSSAIIVNNFAELDGEECIEHYQKAMGHKAWHLGPASLIRKTTKEKAARGHKSVVSVDECLNWLNSKQKNSVLYICFGSICYFSDEMLYEIASGIEASGHNFIWVVPEKKGKEDESEEERKKWLPEGFEERENGLIIRGWAPQVMILSQATVGAFMTHCGWNSVTEAVSAGIPMITWPMHSEQFYNEKLVTDVRRIGVSVGATEWFMCCSQKKEVVSRDNIEKAVRRLMDDTDEAEEIRQRTREFSEKAKQAVQEGGSSHNNLLALIDELKRMRDIPKPLD